MRGAVRCGARLCSWARGSPPLPSPARCFPRRSPPWITASASGCPAHKVSELQARGSGAALAEPNPLGPWEQKGLGLSRG